MGSFGRARAHALCCTVSCLLLVAPAARGDAAAGDRSATYKPADAPPKVSLAIVGDAAGSQDLGGRIGSWFHAPTAVSATKLSRLEASSVFAPSGELGMRIWVIVLSTSSAHIVFAVEQGAGQPPRYLVHDMDLEHGLDELAIEQLSQVVYMSAMALWAGNVESSRRDVEESLLPARQADAAAGGAGAGGTAVTPRAAPVAQPEAPGRDRTTQAADAVRTHVRAGVEYAARDAGDEGALQTVGVMVGWERQQGDWDLGANLAASVLVPDQPAKSGIHLDVRGVTLGLGFEAARRVGGATWVAVEAGPGIELVSYQVTSVDQATLQPNAGGVNPRPVASVRAGVRADVGPARLGLDALLVIGMMRTHYDVLVDGRRSEVLVPWLAQPGVAANVSW
jgi:hypothetical protein